MTGLYCKESNTFQTPGVTPCWMRDAANRFLKLGGREEFSSRLQAHTPPPRLILSFFPEAGLAKIQLLVLRT